MPISWTAERIALLRELYPDHSGAEIAAIIGCTKCAVWNEAQKLGLRKSSDFWNSRKSCRFQIGDDPRNGIRAEHPHHAGTIHRMGA